MPSEELTLDSPLVTQANDIDAVPELIQQLQDGLVSLQSDDHDTRLDLLSKARSLVQALEAPRETMVKHCAAQIAAVSALTLGVETGLWKVMAADGDPARQVEDLASRTAVDPTLLARHLRHLGAMGYVKETEINEYTPTNFTKSMAIDEIGNGYIYASSISAAALRFHEYARKRGFKNPEDPKDTPLMYAYGTDKDAFVWTESLGYTKHFNDHLRGIHHGCRPWMDPNVFPVEDRLVHGADMATDAPFLVDIGGNVGYGLVDFKAQHPKHPGQLILQDLPMLIDRISDLDASIVRMSHDFFTEQPVKGARAYYMRFILHDWQDADCEKIIAHIKDAMKPGYSKLLINEHVIPDKGVEWEVSSIDLAMLTRLCSKERTRTDWFDLIVGRCGMKIVGIWDAGRCSESLIEVELS